MKQYVKEIDGNTVIKTRHEVVIRKDGRVTYNPTEEMVLADGWVEYVPPTPAEPSEEQLFERAKERLIRRIEDHDKSRRVNNCRIVKDGNAMDYWADKHERDSLKNAVRDCITMGRYVYRLDLRELGISLEISCENLLAMLSALEVYAIDCFNKTTDHLYAVRSMQYGSNTVEEIEGYRYEEGYPEVLTFNL